VNSPIIAIDPGVTAGVIFTSEGPAKLPDAPKFLFSAIQKSSHRFPDALWYVENVGTPRLGNSMSTMHTFSKHRGHLEMAFIALGLDRQVRWVNPMDWMSFIDPSQSWPHGNEGKVVTLRKKFFANRAEILYPHFKIPQYAGDAACIYHYGNTSRQA
jgi:hypothetical protein